jgi:hypothetical protein
MRLVGDVEDHRAAVDVAHVRAIGTARIDVGVVGAKARVEARMPRRRRLRIALARAR